MKKNMGDSDKITRISIAIIIAVLYLFGFIKGASAIVLGIIAIIFAATSYLNFCPIYSLFGWNTRMGRRRKNLK